MRSVRADRRGVLASLFALSIAAPAIAQPLTKVEVLLDWKALPTYAGFFLDSRAALTQKYGPEIDADWTVVGQLNIPNLAAPPQPIPTGNQVEDAFEQIALLMSNTFRLANAPQFPKLSFTPIAMYRTIA